MRALKTATLGLLILCLPGMAEEKEKVHMIQSVIQASHGMQEIPFHEVIHGATGKVVYPTDLEDALTRQILDHLSSVCAKIQTWCRQPDLPLSPYKRINEASRALEERLFFEINQLDNFKCEFAKTEQGKIQRAGYPDLRVQHVPSGRIIYVDPKLYSREGESSHLRSFYYDPGGSNKILEDAWHWVLGFMHNGNQGAWEILSWQIVDMHRVPIRFKTEFQASNADLYQKQSVLRHEEKQSVQEHPQGDITPHAERKRLNP